MALPAPAPSDVVVLRSGKRIDAEIVSETSQVLFLQTQLGILRINRSEIRSIEKTGAEEKSAVLAFQLALANTKVAIALHHLSAVTTPTLGEEKLIDEMLLRHRDAILKTAPRSIGTSPHAVLRYFTIRRSTPAPEVFKFALELGVAVGDTTGIETLIDRCSQGRWLPPNHYAAVIQLLSREFAQRPSDVKRWLELLLRFTGERQAEGYLGPEEITALLDSLQVALRACPELATSVTRTLLLHSPAEVRPSVALAAIRYGEDSQSTFTLLSILETIEDLYRPVQFPREILDTVARKHVSLLVQSQSFAEARLVVRKIERLDPDIAAPLLQKIELHEQLKALPPGDALARYRLAKWAQHQGLKEEAEALYRSLLGNDLVASEARAHLKLLELEKDAEHLKEALRSYRQGDYSGAQELLRSFIKTRPHSRLTSEARFLESMAEHMIGSLPMQRRSRGLALLQNA